MEPYLAAQTRVSTRGELNKKWCGARDFGRPRICPVQDIAR